MKSKLYQYTSLLALGLVAGFASPVGANGTVCPPKPKHHAHKSHHEHHPVCAEAPCPAPASLYHSGFYAGAAVGWSHMRAKMHNRFIVTNPTVLAQNSSQSGTKNSNSVVGELLLGWRYVFPECYTAGFEVAGDISNNSGKRAFTHTQNEVFLFNVKFKNRFKVIPSVVIGKVFNCNWHAFLKLGMGIARFKTDLSNVEDINKGFNSAFDKHKTKLGFVPAIGMEYAFTQCVSAVGTVSYEIYKKVNSNFNNVANGALSSDAVKVKPRFVTAKLGILFKI